MHLLRPVSILSLLLTAGAESWRMQPLLPYTWDYIIVGTGPAGLVIADRLSEAGKNVLVLEAGSKSTYASGGREAPEWLKESKEPLSRFDVPGFFGAFGQDPAGHRCADIDVMAACVLGGGSAINSGVWIMPRAKDWDSTFGPGGAQLMASATAKVRARIPGTTNPSQDGKRYFPEAFDITSKLARAAGFSQIDAIKQPDAKNRTFARTPFFGIGGERGGPLGSYLLTTLPRQTQNIKILYNIRVQRLIRYNNQTMGIEYTIGALPPLIIPLFPRMRTQIILSAGAFGTAKILFQSGIGPRDQLKQAQLHLKDRMVDESEWVDLPVGFNLEDHAATYAVIKHPDAGTPYNYSGAYQHPDLGDAALYLDHRAGPLASSNARISLWDEIKGEDAVVRTVQWNGRVGNTANITGPGHIFLTSYLTTSTSRGRLGFAPGSLNMTVLTAPYLRSEHDVEAVVQSFGNLLESTGRVKGLEMVQPKQDEDLKDYVTGFQGNRGSNHWMGSTAVGEVVDEGFKLKGAAGIWVVDAGVLRGVAGNPVAAVVVLAERAAEVLLGQ